MNRAELCLLRNPLVHLSILFFVRLVQFVLQPGVCHADRRHVLLWFPLLLNVVGNFICHFYSCTFSTHIISSYFSFFDNTCSCIFKFFCHIFLTEPIKHHFSSEYSCNRVHFILPGVFWC